MPQVNMRAMLVMRIPTGTSKCPNHLVSSDAGQLGTHSVFSLSLYKGRRSTVLLDCTFVDRIIFDILSPCQTHISPELV